MLMSNWETWFPFGAENEEGAFPSLRELYIKKCSKLKGGFSIDLPSLAKLEIDECPQLVISLRGAPAIHELELMSCNEVLLKELPVGMQRLKVGGFDSMESLPEGLLHSNSCLQELEIGDCPSLVSLPTGGLFIAFLGKLVLRHCDSRMSIPLDLFPNLMRIDLRQCGNLESLTVPEQQEQKLITLDILIRSCPKFVSLPNKMHSFLPYLESLLINDCPEMESFPEGGLPSNLRVINIWKCEKLASSRMGWGLQTLTSLRHVSIDGESGRVVSFPETGLLSSNLTSVFFGNFPNLESFDKEGLQHLNSLEVLTLKDCPKLKCMPDKGLPVSLYRLYIERCPLLKKQWQRRKGKEWRKVARVPCIIMDQEWIE